MIKWTAKLKSKVNELIPRMLEEDCFQSGDWWHSFQVGDKVYDLNVWLEYEANTKSKPVIYNAVIYNTKIGLERDKHGRHYLETDYEDMSPRLTLNLTFQ